MRLAPGLGSIEVISYGRILCMAGGRMEVKGGGRRAGWSRLDRLGHINQYLAL